MSILKFQRLTFSSSAYFGNHIEFRLTGNRLTAGYSVGPMPPEKQSRQLDPDELVSLVQALSRCDVLSWKKKYHSFGVMDGESWSIAIVFDDGKRFKSEGYAEFPPGYEDLKEVLVRMTVKGHEQGGAID